MHYQLHINQKDNSWSFPILAALEPSSEFNFMTLWQYMQLGYTTADINTTIHPHQYTGVYTYGRTFLWCQSPATGQQGQIYFFVTDQLARAQPIVLGHAVALDELRILTSKSEADRIMGDVWNLVEREVQALGSTVQQMVNPQAPTPRIEEIVDEEPLDPRDRRRRKRRRKARY